MMQLVIKHKATKRIRNKKKSIRKLKFQLPEFFEEFAKNVSREEKMLLSTTKIFQLSFHIF